MTAVYRLGQGLRALAALILPLPLDTTLAERFLTPQEMILFRRLKRSEQQHSLRVLRAVLTQADETPPALAAAALLHDVGKTRYPVGLIGKTLPVLVKIIAPERITRWSQGDPAHPLIRPFITYCHHPAYSGELLQAAGSDPDVLWLAAHHAESPDGWGGHPLLPLLIRLQAADDKS